MKSHKTAAAAAALLTAVTLLCTACSQTTATGSTSSDSSQAAAASGESQVTLTSAELKLGTARTTQSGDNYYIPALDEADQITDWSTAASAAVAGSGNAQIALSGSSASISGSGASVSGSVITITVSGVYTLSGNLNGQIIVNTKDNGAVVLVMDNASISSPAGPAIWVQNAPKTVLFLSGGTQNSLSDSTNYTPDESGDPNAAVFSCDDLTVSGTGALSVTGNYNNAVTGKDGIKIMSGTLSVTSADDGIQGKDYVYIAGGTLTLNTNGDGIKSTNDATDTPGCVIMTAGTVTITSGTDGIQAAGTAAVVGGTVSITSGGGSVNASTSSGWGQNGMWGGQKTSASSADTEDSSSAKGIKATALVTIGDCVLTVDSSDDSIHSNGNISMDGGTVTLRSGDDGIHADTRLVLAGGTVTVTKSYEGLESAVILLSGGSYDITTSDDGLNVAGGQDSSALGGRPGQNNFTSNTSQTFTMTGGSLKVNASGDGIDVNGSVTVTGGDITVCGPTDSGNAALDYDGTFLMNGGSLIAAGSTGMAMTVSDTSAQAAVQVTLTSVQAAGTTFTVTDSSGTVVASITPEKQYQSVVVSCSAFTKGSAFTVSAGGTVIDTFTVSGILNTVGSSAGNMGGGMGGGKK